MKFKYRFAYYAIGLILGLFFVTQFLGAKADAKGVEFCYFPNCRVLQDLRKKPLTISDEVQTVFKENWVNLEDIKNSLRNGSVDFSKSNIPLENGNLYVIEGKTTNNEQIIINMINYPEKVVLHKIEKL